MSRKIGRVLCLFGALLAATAVVAQPFGTDLAGTVYRLNDAASYQQGCFDPCLCPLSEPAPVRGAFVLGRKNIGDVVDFHEITEINWSVGPAGMTTHTITGTGSYRVTNYGVPRLHALDLQLSIDGGETQHFFSDFVPFDANDGSIDLTVTMNDMVCFDIVIRVSASPVPNDELIPYRLFRGSTYQQGCFDPCDCLLEEPVPIRGRFFLVKLFDYGTFAEFAIVRARIAFGRDSFAQTMLAYRGFGRYTLIQGFAGPIHSMELALARPDGELMFFDSGLQNTAPVFPAIHIVVDMNNMVCFDKVLTIRAGPPSYMMPMPYADVPPGLMPRRPAGAN